MWHGTCPATALPRWREESGRRWRALLQGWRPLRLLRRPLLLLRTHRLLGRSIRRHFRDARTLPAFAVRDPHVIDRMLDRVQARTRREHPAREDALDLSLQRHLVNFDEGIGVGGLGWRARIAHTRRHL